MSSKNDTGGVLPQIRDEAANTPKWVPLTGLALLLVLGLLLAGRVASRDAESADEASVSSPAATEAPAAAEADGNDR